jgi:hypothetical protein
MPASDLESSIRAQAAELEALEALRASRQLHWKRFFGRGFGAFFALIIASRVIIGQTGESKAVAMLPLLALAWLFFGGIYKGVRSAYIIRHFRGELFKRLGARLAAQALPGLEADPAQDVLNQDCAPVPFAGFSPDAVLKGRAGGRDVILVAGEVVAGKTQEAARPATLLQWRLNKPWPDDLLAVPAKGKGKGLLGLLDDVGFRTSKERRQERQDQMIGRYDVDTGHAAFDQAFRSKATSMQPALPPKALLDALLALGEKTQGSFAFSLRGDWASLLYRDEALFWPAGDWFYAPLDPAQMAKDWDGHGEIAAAMAGLGKLLP